MFIDHPQPGLYHPVLHTQGGVIIGFSKRKESLSPICPCAPRISEPNSIFPTLKVLTTPPSSLVPHSLPTARLPHISYHSIA